MKKRFRFDSADFAELTDELHGPARGWYQIYSFRVEGEPDLEELKWCLKDETCARVVLDLAAYRDQDLDQAALAHIRQILAFFDDHEKDMILRVTYDTQGKCLEHEPALFSQVIGHIRQLGPVIGERSQRILLFEGMLVGNWGEMHGSKFLTKKYMERLNEALAQDLPGIPRAVRRPVQWRMLHQTPPGPGTTVGLFNDGIFGSDTDLGTFAAQGGAAQGGASQGDAAPDDTSVDWEEPWPLARELAFERQLSAFVPQCGEAVCGESYGRHTLSSTVERLRDMGLTYLNGVYDARILDLWRGWTWQGPDPWRGMNGYDYIGRHLGYRFRVRKAAARQNGPSCDLTLTIENTGFSGFYQEAEAWLILAEENGQESRFLTDWDVREWKSGQTVSLTGRIPCRQGTLWLHVRRKWDHGTIPFANGAPEQGWVRIGELKCV